MRDISENDSVRGIFLVTRKSLLLTRTGAPYLSLTLSDRTGDIEARAWEDAERCDEACERGDYVEISAVASEYNGEVQLKVESLDRVAPESVDARDFLVSSRYDVDLMWGELKGLVDGVGDPFIRKLLHDFLDDEEIGPRLREAPAAKGVHHPFIGGLLEHTLSVVQLAHRIADHYPRANRDLLVAGAFLHDLGKVRELSWDRGRFEYTTEGRLVGHLLIAVQWIREKAARIPNFPPELETHLVHLVAAHHGQLDYGSPKVPQTLEAMLVHALDELDSRVQSWTMIMDRDKGEEWTSYQRLYDRALFKGPGWGGERLGHGPAPESQRWNGESVYRREHNGEDVLAGKVGGEGRDPDRPSRSRDVSPTSKASSPSESSFSESSPSSGDERPASKAESHPSLFTPPSKSTPTETVGHAAPDADATTTKRGDAEMTEEEAAQPRRKRSLSTREASTREADSSEPRPDQSPTETPLMPDLFSLPRRNDS